VGALIPAADARAVLLQACLNGSRDEDEHPLLPLSPEALAADARAVVEAGAVALHVHPRREGAESLDAEVCAAALTAIRSVCPGVTAGVTTGAWIEPDLQRRLSLIEQWTVLPDHASVNFSEDGAEEVCRLLLDRGIGVEAGLASVEDAQRLIDSGLARWCVRVLVEVEGINSPSAVAAAMAIEEVLARADVATRRLYHGTGIETWAVLDAALAGGHDVRIGLEDTLLLPDGRPARDNAELVAEAVTRMRQHRLYPAI
jgi:uncharacterized protein (DUF849 family)